MDESKILSTEEVDALLKAAQDKESDLSKIISSIGRPNYNEYSINYKAIAHIVELTWSECDRIFSTFIRKKVTVKPKNAQFDKLHDCLKDRSEKHIYTLYHINTTNDYCLVVIDLVFLHQMIDALYGGVLSSGETIIEAPGNIGMIVAEKLCTLALEAFALAAKEYGSINFEKKKSVTIPNLISKMTMEDDMYMLSYSVTIGELESELVYILPIEFLHKFLPMNKMSEDEFKHNRVWREAIKNQVIDSSITITAALPEINIKANEVLSLKVGDLISINDPTLVDVYLNDVKLFCANAGLANSNRIIKILNEQ